MSIEFFQSPNGVFGYDNTTQQALIQQAITNGWTNITGNWPPPPTLAQVQTTQNATLTAAYNTATHADITYTSKGGITETYQANPMSISNLQNMILAFAQTQTMPTGFFWVASDNTQVPFTYADLQALGNALGVRGATLFAELQMLKAQVNAATTVAAVQAITFPS
jgi:Domain of unknown function (DUF4376)